MTKRFQPMRIIDNIVKVYDSETDGVLDLNTVCEKLNDQQATIRRLQDLCGESDSGNAKLRIENKKLKEENEQLRQSVEYWQKKYEEGTETFQID